MPLHLYEYVLAQCVVRVYSPAPKPFSPFSSSSSNRKLRGTFAPILIVFLLDELQDRGCACDHWKCGLICRTVGHVVCLNDVVWFANAFTGLKDWWGHSPLHMK